MKGYTEWRIFRGWYVPKTHESTIYLDNNKIVGLKCDAIMDKAATDEKVIDDSKVFWTKTTDTISLQIGNMIVGAINREREGNEDIKELLEEFNIVFATDIVWARKKTADDTADILGKS